MLLRRLNLMFKASLLISHIGDKLCLMTQFKRNISNHS